MSKLEWVVLGALMFGILIFCARIMKRGLTTLDEDRREYSARIAEGERRLAEERKNIPASEQLYLLEAAVRDLLRLESLTETCRLRVMEHGIELASGERIWTIELLMRERSLRSCQRVLHGQSRWLLRSGDAREEFGEISALMASLVRQIHGDGAPQEEPEHLARRVAARKTLRRPTSRGRFAE